jgi:hypothetical protein
MQCIEPIIALLCCSTEEEPVCGMVGENKPSKCLTKSPFEFDGTVSSMGMRRGSIPLNGVILMPGYLRLLACTRI